MTTTAPRALVASGPVHQRLWYKDAVIYELHVRSFHDGNADGVGDFQGLIGKLDYLQSLGVTALWLLPFYPSPLRDDGYDISDYRGVHPSYGTLRDFRQFLREAHRRGLKVITELVLAHTSDAHPWFQRARHAPSGSAHRDFYVWSETPDRFADARVIFRDFENSNWTFDPVAGAYFWHRFYSHQPSLNYDSPAVRQAMFDVVDYWLSMGVDGLRLDAVPYLYAREGTTCENLPETFAFLRELRAHIDERFEDRMLLAEANQWPEDAVAYMGDGDICHMAFHFPLMPRMFMASRQEDRFPLVDILSQIPATNPESQWALFLRNHDELTLEMVTDEERDYMYRSYAQDPQARVNVGIRRRLAPLLGNDRRLIEMMNGLLFAMPGTPIVYYGDEIGMGDNIYLGDRNAVRTPMQWNDDRNAGFSDANPQRLFLPVVIDPEYHSQTINVEGQLQNPHSLLWWMRRLIALRQRYQAFGRGDLTILYPENRKVFAFIRSYGSERILCVFNLSRHAQYAQLDLSELRGTIPTELFGNQAFPQIGELAYFVTLAPYGFYWFSLEAEAAPVADAAPAFDVPGRWETLFTGPARRAFEEWLPTYVAARRWFGGKSRSVTAAHVVDAVGVPAPDDLSRRGNGTTSHRLTATVVLVQLEYDHDAPEHYLLPLAFETGSAGEEVAKWHPEAVVAELRTEQGSGTLIDALYEPTFISAMAALLTRRRSVHSTNGRIVGVPATNLRAYRNGSFEDLGSSPLAAEQSNSSVALGDVAIMKFVRRLEDGVNPSVELGAFLNHRTGDVRVPRLIGSIEYQGRCLGTQPATIAVLEERVPSEEDGWTYVVDALARGLEEGLATQAAGRVDDLPGASGPSTGASPLVGPHLQWASLLGRRTAELHLALVSDDRHVDFAPEPLTRMDRQSLFHGARSLTRHVLANASRGGDAPAVAQVAAREAEIVERLRRLSASGGEAFRIRCHGDFHLGQVLWTGRDFAIIDFEGEPSRSLGWRRLKRPAAFDLAGMLRSIDYAGHAAARLVDLELGPPAEPGDDSLRDDIADWRASVSASFLEHYLQTASQSPFLPSDLDGLSPLLDFFRLEKAVAELGYELDNRPDWVEIPARGILDLLDTDR